MTERAAEPVAVELDADGPAAPPRRNGELVFEAPWEGRVFGLAVSLCEAGRFAWGDFRRHLIAEITAWDRAHPDGQDYSYYARWQTSLERVLAERDVTQREEVSARADLLRARPAGHDHSQDVRRS